MRNTAALALVRSAALAALASPLLALLPGCGDEGAAHARRMIREKHNPRIAEIVVEDLRRHREGLRKAAALMSKGFVRVSGEQQDKDMRKLLRLFRLPRRGNKAKIDELVISPLSFMATVDADGMVIARDAPRERDRMKGLNLAELFPVVKQALSGEEGFAIGEFESTIEGGESSVTIIMAAPSRYEDKVVGGVVLGIPLWRLAQRLSRQLQAEHAGTGIVLWVYVYRGDRIFHHGTPQSLDMLVPNANARRAGYQKSPGGFTGEAVQFGSWYGFGVRPLRILGDDVGVIVFRMDPKKK
jgi:hypothetical protein